MANELFASTIGSSAASTTLSGNSGGAITSGAATLKVASNNGFSVTGGQMRAVIEPGTANAEVVIITGIATLTFTVTRGQEGTTAVAHNDGSVFIAEITAGALGNMLQTPAGSDGQYYIRRSGLWVPDTPSYADLTGVPDSFAPSAHATSHNSGGSDAVTLAPAQVTGTAVVNADSRLSDARTPTAHASTHLPNGADSTAALLRSAHNGPNINGYLAWNYDVLFARQNLSTLTAGQLFLYKVMVPAAITIASIDFYVATAGTGVTALANCFVGLYDSGGTRRYASGDQSSAWATTGSKTVGSVGYLTNANDFVYVAFLVGTQSTTNMQIATYGANSLGTIPTDLNLTAATTRAGKQGSGLTSLPATITLSSNTINQTQIAWVGLR